ncbi:MAG: CHAT domain-containing tetratricopeptide repeat protein [Blastocatellia bacterium]
MAAIDANNSNQGVETVRQVIEGSGNFRLEVLSRRKEAPAGRYEVRIEELRAATEKDRAMQAALQEALKLSGEFNQLNRAGKFDEALSVAEKALSLREQYLPADDPLIAQSLATLGGICMTKGDYLRAEEVLDRALAINEKLRGVDHPDIASVARLLGLACQRKGDYKKAEQQFQRALAIREKAFNNDDPLVAQSLDNLAGLYADKKEYALAGQLYKRALAIREKTLKQGDPALLFSQNNLASIYQETGALELAEPLYRQVLAISEKVLGVEHPNVATTLNNLAVLTLLKGEYEKAEPMYKRALAIREKVLGMQHPAVAQSLDTFAVLYELKGDIAKAVELRTRGLKIRERHLGLIMASGSEEQKRAYLAQATLADETNITISLHARSAPKNPQAAAMALNFILQRKGRVLDAMTDSFGALRRRLDAQDRALLQQYSTVNSQLATLILGGQGNVRSQAEIEKLESERQQLESAISARSREFRQQSQPATIESIQKLLPANAALVEIAAYRPFDPKAVKHGERYGDARYAAYVLKPEGPPAFVELGEAAEIDRGVDALREALRDPRRRDAVQLARALGGMVMQPIRPLLGKTRRVLLSPEGSLNLVPFAALVDPRNHYLVKHYEFSYLTSGRDLLRLQTHAPSRQGPLVVADPDFGERAASDAPAEAAAAFDLSRAFFTPLPGTAEEALALKTILPGATVLTKGQATESALKQADGPSILHVATHGFFFLKGAPTGPPAPAAAQRVLIQQAAPGQPSQMAAPLENPLLRSGLGLAGANLRKSGDEDGILTAFEAAGLNLWGTKLVVLSACDTGVGEVKTGDGVYGLRRALALAGAESQVMSLWPVSDRGTRELMTEYYKALEAGKGRSEAMRQVQLHMLKSGQRRHPYYWASFITSGEWADLAGKRP